MDLVEVSIAVEAEGFLVIFGNFKDDVSAHSKARGMFNLLEHERTDSHAVIVRVHGDLR